MSRLDAVTGASAIVIGMVQLAPFSVAFAQSNENALPPVTVEAPETAARHAARKPVQRVAVARRRTPQPVAIPPARLFVSANADSGGVNASYGTPPVVARFQLPQPSTSIT